MHNRAILDQAFATAGVAVTPAIETNSVLTLALSVGAGEVCAVLPGAMVDAVRSHGGLEALPLVAPEVRTPIGFMTQTAVRPSRALEAALALIQSPEWQQEVAAHSGSLRGSRIIYFLNRPMCGFNLPKAAWRATVGHAHPNPSPRTKAMNPTQHDRGDPPRHP